MSNVSKKRNRVPKSCSLCRAKKVKCDRAYPTCGICLKNDTVLLCHYEEPSWTSGVTSFDKTASVLNDYNSSRLNHKSILDSPYQHAARIPIAFIPSTLSSVTNNSVTAESKRRKTESDVQLDRIDSLQSQVETLNNTISDLVAVLHANNLRSSTTGSRTGNFLSPIPLNSDQSPIYDFKSKNDYINFHEDFKSIHVRKSRVMCRGPSSLFSLVDKDNFMKIAWHILHDKEKEERNKIMFGLKVLPSSSKKEVFPLSYSLDSIKEKLKEQIEKVLPHKKAIWLFVKRFFDSVYPFYPFVSKDDFIKKISKLIGDECYMDEPVVVNMERRIDFAHIGLLLIILRMAYLSVIKNRKPVDSDPTEQQIHDYCCSNPMSFNLVTVAQLCLNQFRILRKADLPTFQLALFIRIYNREAPEYDGNTDTFDVQIFTGLLFQIAIAIGLHLNPVDFEDGESHLRKKMWLFLKQLDLEESISTGVPLRVCNIASNAPLPNFVYEKAGCLEDVLENRIIRTMHEDDQWYGSLKELVILLSSFKSLKIEDVLLCVSSVTRSSFSSYPSLNSIITDETIRDDVTRCREIKRYSTCKKIALTIYYHIMLHYEQIGDYPAAISYLSKILDLNTDVIANYNFRSISGALLSCGNEFLYYSIQSIFTLSLSSQLSLILRVNKCSLEITNLGKLEVLDEIKRAILKNISVLLFAISKFAKDYYTTWRFVRVISLILVGLQESSVFERNGNTVSMPNMSPEFKIPIKNFFDNAPENILSDVYRFVDRDRFQFLLVDKSDYKEGLHQPYDYYENICNDTTWTRHQHARAGDSFYANLSNHNISYEGLSNDTNNFFDDLIDF